MNYFEGKQPDRVGILYSQEEGICDVIFYQGSSVARLSSSQNPWDCSPSQNGVTEVMIRLTEATSLVGFTGVVDSEGIRSLGLLLLDTLEPEC